MVQDPELMELVKKKNIMVESCPTSNFITNCVSEYAVHPCQDYYKAKVPVCLNTDDPMLFGTVSTLSFAHHDNRI